MSLLAHSTIIKKHIQIKRERPKNTHLNAIYKTDITYHRGQ